MGTLLITDDREEIRLLLQEVLETAGHTALTAAGGQETLEILKKKEVDLVLLDMKMSGMDGLETLKAAKKSWPFLKIIMMTACEDINTLKETARFGASGYICKPFDLEDLRDVVQRELQSRAVPSS